MGQFDQVDQAPRRVLTMFYLVDSSGSMEGERIASVNTAMKEICTTLLPSISSDNADAEIKVALLDFSTEAKWVYPQPISSEQFTNFVPFEAGGMTYLGAALKELNSKLSVSHGFMNQAAGSYAPVIILLSDGEPNDDYKRELAKIRENNWFKAGIKLAIAIGDDANRDVLFDFTGSKEGVFTVHNVDQLKAVIKLMSVTASQVASKSASVGADAPSTKVDEVMDKLQEQVDKNDDLSGVGQGTEQTENESVDDWSGGAADASGWD